MASGLFHSASFSSRDVSVAANTKQEVAAAKSDGERQHGIPPGNGDHVVNHAAEAFLLQRVAACLMPPVTASAT